MVTQLHIHVYIPYFDFWLTALSIISSRSIHPCCHKWQDFLPSHDTHTHTHTHTQTHTHTHTKAYKRGDLALALGTTSSPPQAPTSSVALLFPPSWTGLGQDPGGPSLWQWAGKAWRRLLPHPRLCLSGPLPPWPGWSSGGGFRTTNSPAGWSILPPKPSSVSRGCLPGCSAVIYWQLLLARAHGRRSSNTRKKSHQLLIPE